MVGKGNEYFITAAKYGRKDIILRLLEKGIDINAMNEDGCSALHAVSIIRNQVEMIQFLLDNGANPNTLTEGGMTAAHCAITKESLELLKTKERFGFSDYIFQLIIFGSCFQITHSAEDPTLSQVGLEGVSFPIRNITGSFFHNFYSSITELISYFCDFINRKASSESSDWLEKTDVALQKISDLIVKPSKELALLYQNGEGIPIHTGWSNEKGHATYMWLENHVLFHCNTGQRSQGKFPGITFYYIKEPAKVTPEVIENLRLKEREYIEHGVINELDLKLLGVSSSKNQKGGFCEVRSLLLLVKGIMIMKQMKHTSNKEEIFQLIQAAEKEIASIYHDAKIYVMDCQLEKLLDLYESKDFTFQPETSMLLMTLAKAPEECTQIPRLIKFLHKSKIHIEMQSNGKNIAHYLKGEKQLRWMEELFGKETVSNAVPRLVNESNEIHSITPLILALQEKRLQSVNLLLNLKADVNQPDKEGCLPIIYACEEGTEAVTLLLQHGANPLKKIDQKGLNGLEYAMMCERSDLLQLMLESIDEKIKPTVTQELFFDALNRNKLKLLPCLIQAGANPNQPDMEGKLPILIACFQEGTEAVSLLLQHGANPLKKIIGQKINVLEFAIISERSDVLQLMLDSIDEKIRPVITQELFFYALNSNKLKLLPYLIQAGANPNQPDENGDLPLLIACNIEGIEAVKLLLQHGANPLKILDNKFNGLQYAMICERSDLLQLMLGSIDVEIKPKVTQELLFLALDKNELKLLPYLIQAGADPNQPDEEGYLPILRACGVEGTEAVNLLLQHGADPLKNLDGTMNGLQCATIYEQSDLLKLMLDSIDVEIKATVAQELFFLASDENKLAVLPCLIQAGADPSKSNDYGA